MNNVCHHDHIAAKTEEYLVSSTWPSPAAGGALIPLHFYGAPGMIASILCGGKKVKVKVALWGFSTLRPFGLLYSNPQQVPAFISRGATHRTDARDLYQRRRELLPNFASKFELTEIC